MKLDNTVVTEILSGDKDSYDFLIERYKNRLFAVVIRLTGNGAEAEKVLKALFVKIYENLRNYREPQLFSEWLNQEAVLFFQKEFHGFPASIKTPVDYIDFYNPHYINIEEAIASLPSETRMVFLLHHLLGLELDKLAGLLSMEKEGARKKDENAIAHIRKYTLNLEEAKGEECLPFQQILQYFDYAESEQEQEEIEDHLEFCPSCREVLEAVKKEKSMLETVLVAPLIAAELNRGVLQSITPYTKKVAKHKTWKYQLSVIGIIAVIFLFSVFVVPAIKPLVNKVSTYLQYGTVYNVWVDGTYVAEDQDISLEVTGIEIDSLHMSVFYEIENNKSSRNVDFFGEDFDFYQNGTVEIVDEEGNTYPLDVAQDISRMYSRHYTSGGTTEQEETEIPKSFYIKALNSEELPDKFTLKLNIKQIQSTFGSWQLEIPIHYDKVEDTVEIVDLDETIVLDDKIEVQFLSIAYGKNGSRLTYRVNRVEEETERIEALLKEHDQKYRSQEFNPSNIHVGIQIMNQNGNEMVPMYYSMMNMGEYENEIVELDLFPYYLRKSNDYYEVEGKEEEVGRYTARIAGYHYSEPAFVSINIPLEETEKKPLDVEVDGMTLKELTVDKVSSGSNGRESYEIKINAKKNADFQKNYNWEFVNEAGDYIPMEEHEMYYPDNEQKDDALFRLLRVIVPKYSNKTDHLILRANMAYSEYWEEEGMEIPLYKEEENRE